MKKINDILESKWFFLAAGFVVSAAIIFTVRLINYQAEEQVHYHANFAVFVDGEREPFDNPAYYEEIGSEGCGAEHTESPLDRAHMHGSVNDVVHVEDHLVTWGHFLQNIGWAAQSSFLKTPESLLLADNENKVSFILNGKSVDSVNRQTIGDQDRLLISYGSTSAEELELQYSSIASTAEKYNNTPDPGSCSAGKAESGIKDRLKSLL